MSEEQKPKPIEEIVNEVKGHAWNQYMKPFLEPLNTWFKRPEWTDGLRMYLTSQKELSFRMLVKGNTTPTDDKFVMGRISMLMDLLDMPGVIERNRELAEKAKTRPQPGTYTDV